MQQANVDLNLGTKQARRRGFPAQLDRVVPWADVEALIEPHALKSKSGHPPFALQTVPHIHFMPQWFTLSDPAMQDALHNLPLFREFAPLTRERRLPDGSPIARFRRLLDCHRLAAQIEQTNNPLQDLVVKPSAVIVDLGYRGLDKDVAPVEVIHRGKFKSLTPKQKIWLKRRQAIEPLFGHAKADHRMDQRWLKGAEGNALHAVLCAAGFNIRWLLRAIAKRGLAAVLLALTAMALYANVVSRRTSKPQTGLAA
jgi:IS5 family transposase